MKRIFLTLSLPILFCLSAMSQAVDLNGTIVGHNKVTGIVHLKDGSAEEFPRMDVPHSTDKAVHAFDAAKKKHSFQATDVEYLEMWNDAAPDSHYILCYLENCKYPMAKSIWAAPIAVGEHAIGYRVGVTYDIDKNGELIFWTRSAPVYGNIFKKKHKDEWLFAVKATNKRVMAFFADDSKLHAKLKEKKVSFFSDFNYLIENYNPE